MRNAVFLALFGILVGPMVHATDILPGSISVIKRASNPKAAACGMALYEMAKEVDQDRNDIIGMFCSEGAGAWVIGKTWGIPTSFGNRTEWTPVLVYAPKQDLRIKDREWHIDGPPIYWEWCQHELERTEKKLQEQGLSVTQASCVDAGKALRRADITFKSYRDWTNPLSRLKSTFYNTIREEVIPNKPYVLYGAPIFACSTASCTVTYFTKEQGNSWNTLDIDRKLIVSPFTLEAKDILRLEVVKSSEFAISSANLAFKSVTPLDDKQFEAAKDRLIKLGYTDECTSESIAFFGDSTCKKIYLEKAAPSSLRSLQIVLAEDPGKQLINGTEIWVLKGAEKDSPLESLFFRGKAGTVVGSAGGSSGGAYDPEKGRTSAGLTWRWSKNEKNCLGYDASGGLSKGIFGDIDEKNALQACDTCGGCTWTWGSGKQCLLYTPDKTLMTGIFGDIDEKYALEACKTCGGCTWTWASGKKCLLYTPDKTLMTGIFGDIDTKYARQACQQCGGCKWTWEDGKSCILRNPANELIEGIYGEINSQYMQQARSQCGQ